MVDEGLCQIGHFSRKIEHCAGNTGSLCNFFHSWWVCVKWPVFQEKTVFAQTPIWAFRINLSSATGTFNSPVPKRNARQHSGIFRWQAWFIGELFALLEVFGKTAGFPAKSKIWRAHKLELSPDWDVDQLPSGLNSVTRKPRVFQNSYNFPWLGWLTRQLLPSGKVFQKWRSFEENTTFILWCSGKLFPKVGLSVFRTGTVFENFAVFCWQDGSIGQLFWFLRILPRTAGFPRKGIFVRRCTTWIFWMVSTSRASTFNYSFSKCNILEQFWSLGWHDWFIGKLFLLLWVLPKTAGFPEKK